MPRVDKWNEFSRHHSMISNARQLQDRLSHIAFGHENSELVDVRNMNLCSTLCLKVEISPTQTRPGGKLTYFFLNHHFWVAVNWRMVMLVTGLEVRPTKLIRLRFLHDDLWPFTGWCQSLEICFLAQDDTRKFNAVTEEERKQPNRA